MSQEKKPDNSKRLVEFAQLPITASAASKKGTAKPPQNVIVIDSSNPSKPPITWSKMVKLAPEQQLQREQEQQLIEQKQNQQTNIVQFGYIPRTGLLLLQQVASELSAAPASESLAAAASNTQIRKQTYSPSPNIIQNIQNTDPKPISVVDTSSITKKYILDNRQLLDRICDTILNHNDPNFIRRSLKGGNVLYNYANKLNDLTNYNNQVPLLFSEDYDILFILPSGERKRQHYGGLAYDFLKLELLLKNMVYHLYTSTDEKFVFGPSASEDALLQKLYNLNNIYLYKITNHIYGSESFKIIIYLNRGQIKLTLFDITVSDNKSAEDKEQQYLLGSQEYNIIPDIYTYIRLLMHSIISRSINNDKDLRKQKEIINKCKKDIVRLRYLFGLLEQHFGLLNIDFINYYKLLFVKIFNETIFVPCFGNTPPNRISLSEGLKSDLYFLIENPDPRGQKNVEIIKQIEEYTKIQLNSKPGGGKTTEMFHHCY